MVRWPLYLFSAAEPVLVLLAANSRAGAWELAASLLAVSALHAVACVALLRAGLAAHLGGPRPPARLVAVAAGGAVAVVAVGAAVPGFTADPGDGVPVSLTMALIAGGALTGAVAPLLRTPALLGCVLLGAVAAGGLVAIVWAGASEPDEAPGTAAVQAGAFYGYTILLVAISYRVSTWMLGVVWEIDRSRAAHASLAVAEERLRFARDLHDVLGHNLSLMAVQSELAARLATRGDAAAVERMLEVRQVAHDSLREMRAVVDGYRRADLGAELAGARSLLRSAGVACRVIGEVGRDGGDGALPASAQATLGWVVREATTNVIHHSEATTCTIDLDVRDLDVRGGPGRARTAVLRITNDGLPPVGAATTRRDGSATVPGAGSGLAGLEERLAGLGGVLTVTRKPGGCFVLEARLPIDAAEGTAPVGTPPPVPPVPPAPPAPAAAGVPEAGS
ncbi:sensor histidine kinase [Frankia sp. CN7]|uniref:Sensor histidine kinase n=2 Tax=Frankia nepalensis TaxID=1836974 RepID=A0A937RJE9_9ACTN|nr:sensor histidine kinase [Frankia nepalensis]MBL7514013.1 sensor histidine kinase [Frankia nepalensis]MBL7627056.1 sensor histidine kinase [Frankia nepalensis]